MFELGLQDHDALQPVDEIKVQNIGLEKTEMELSARIRLLEGHESRHTNESCLLKPRKVICFVNGDLHEAHWSAENMAGSDAKVEPGSVKEAMRAFKERTSKIRWLWLRAVDDRDIVHNQLVTTLKWQIVKCSIKVALDPFIVYSCPVQLAEVAVQAWMKSKVQNYFQVIFHRATKSTQDYHLDMEWDITSSWLVLS